ncbi:YfhO family protein [Capnocytophaga canimorsus]|uniref:YfhO family protein n=1 Tax=Capnocytophaga canimorsus TaxID=28188 RepID=UPI0037CE5544
MKTYLQKMVPHFVVLGLFITISLAFFYPVLQGKAIWQSDIVQYSGMAKERNDFREDFGQESYWTNSAFVGMPTYQLGANYPYDMVKKIDKTIRFLPRPADYLFLYFVGFYLLLLVLKVDYKTAFLGAVAFGFSTYLIIIIGVGHNAKAHAIGYFAPVLAGLLLTFRGKYLWGGLLTAVAFALEISANHYQMTYYLLLLILVLGAFQTIYAWRKTEFKSLLKSVGVIAVALFLGGITNATSLLATQEYAQWSTRSKSELTLTPKGLPKVTSDGLSKEYITEYSYGISESLNLIVPRLFGGSNHEALGKDSHTYQFLVNQGVPTSQALDFSNALPTYWGQQPIVAAPAYVGAVVFFLFVLALFLVEGRIKWWLLSGSILALLLSWGKNFDVLTDFMIDYFPMYNKFRAVSSIQVILELCVPLLAMLGFYRFIKNTPEANKKPLLYTTYVVFGLLFLLFISKEFFSFSGGSDALITQYYGSEILIQLIEDRKSMYISDLLRTAGFAFAVLVTLILFQIRKISQNIAYVFLFVLIVLDLAGVAKRYVNNSDFTDKRKLTQPFEASKADLALLKDDSVYRVYEPSVGLNGARTSYFHHSMGGYHAAKPRRLQELFDYQVSQGNTKVLDMLNVKYILTKDEKGQTVPIQNPNALGNAWFVTDLKTVEDDDQMIQSLTQFVPKTEAFILAKDAQQIKTNFVVDSTATITLKSYQPNKLIYESVNENEGFAVFSEAHYPKGWQVTIDENPTQEYRVNFLLRGLYIPKGKHNIVFEFQPPVVQIGSKITLVGNVLLCVWLLAAGLISYKKMMSVKKIKYN